MLLACTGRAWLGFPELDNKWSDKSVRLSRAGLLLGTAVVHITSGRMWEWAERKGPMRPPACARSLVSSVETKKNVGVGRKEGAHVLRWIDLQTHKLNIGNKPEN